MSWQMEGTADPFELFVVSADLTQYVAVAGNVNPATHGIWVVAPGIGPLGTSLGEQLKPPVVTALNTPYEIVIAVDSLGGASVTVKSAGTFLGTIANLVPGLGPYYVVLGQRLGRTAAGTQSAFWSSVGVTTP
jgi:hypothetical protein